MKRTIEVIKVRLHHLTTNNWNPNPNKKSLIKVIHTGFEAVVSEEDAKKLYDLYC